MRYVEQVQDDAAPGAFWARAGAAYREGNIRVAARSEVEDVLGAAYRAEGALDRLVLQAHGHRPLPGDTGKIAEHVVFLDGEQPLGERLIVLRQSPHELLQRDVFQTFGDEGFVGNLLGLYRAAHHAGQDDSLARDVETGEVVARVGLGVVEVHRLSDGLGERRPASTALMTKPRVPLGLA